MNDEPNATAGDHPDLDDLAQLVPDAADGTTVPVDADLRAHVDGCAQCQAKLAELPAALQAVRDDLAGLPDVSMPADVAARVDEALATSRGTVLPSTLALTRRKRRFGGGALAGSAAAAAILLFVGAVVVSNVNDDNDGGALTGAAGADAASELPSVTSSGHNYTTKSLGDDLPDLLAGNFAALRPPPVAGAVNEGGNNDGSTGTEGTAGGGTTGSKPNKQQDSLRGGRTPETADAPVVRSLTLKTDAAFLARCLISLELEPGSTAAAVDIGTFKDREAAVIVITRPAITDSVDVYVIPPDCPAGQLIYYERVELPPP